MHVALCSAVSHSKSFLLDSSWTGIVNKINPESWILSVPKHITHRFVFHYRLHEAPEGPRGITFWRPCLEVGRINNHSLLLRFCAALPFSCLYSPQLERNRYFAVHRVVRLPLRYGDIYKICSFTWYKNARQRLSPRRIYSIQLSLTSTAS